MRKLIYLTLTAAFVFALAQSCKKSDSGNINTGGSFDRTGMLTNISTNIIIPAYTSYQAATATMDAAVTAFNVAPSVTTLATLQAAFKAAYLQWQSVSTFDLGPAADILLRINTNTYPVNLTQINSNITSNTYNAGLGANSSAKGFPAIDYLLFGVGADNNAIVLQYTTDANAANRKTYLAALSAELKTNATTVLSAWTGSYKATFIAANGTDIGSSVGQLTNELVQDYENLKNFEIGIPAGEQSVGTPLPAEVQAYYSGISLQLCLAHIKALQNIYMGASGLGFDDYLINANAKYNGGLLNDAIVAQFGTAIAKLQTLTDPLSANIQNNNTAVIAAYTELQKLTVLLKTDMTSSLGIEITYQDMDGD